MGNLSELYESQGKLAEAGSLAVEGLEIARRTGNEHLISLAKARVASCYMDQNRLTEAEALMVEVMEHSRRVLGAGRPETLVHMHNLAMLYRKMGEGAKAEPLLLEMLELGRPSLGVTHPDMVDAAIQLADLYLLDGRSDRALPLLEAVMNGTLDRSGANHPGLPVEQLLTISALLGAAYEEAGHRAKAESLYREALETALRQHEEASSVFTSVQVCLADNLLEQKRYAEAEPLLRESLAFRERRQPEAWRTSSTRSMLGGSLLGQKRYAEAEPLLLAGYEGMMRREEPIPAVAIVRKARLREAIERLVQLYEATGQDDRADEWRGRLPGPYELPDDVFAPR